MRTKTNIDLIPPRDDCEQCLVRKTAFCDRMFKALDDDELKEKQELILKLRDKQVLVPARSSIYREGERHDYIYTWHSGWGVLFKSVKNTDKRQILQFILPGDLIGFETTANGVMPHSAGALNEAVLCAYPRKQFEELLATSPRVSSALLNMKSQTLELCQRQLGRKTAKERISFVLMGLYYRILSLRTCFHDNVTKTIALPITQEDMGDATGLTNVHVNRIYKELTDEKLISWDNKLLTILDEERLCEIADFNPAMIHVQPTSHTRR